MGRSFARRGAGLAALAAALALISPGLAGAATLTLAGSTVTYQASPGELNALTININGSDEYVFTDTVSIGNSGCTVVSATTVTCPNTSVSAIIVNLGDLADSASLRAVDDVTVVSGNAGDDSISISDSMRVNRIKAVVDVNGNAGSDSLTIDNSADPAQNSFAVSPTSVGAGPFDFLFGTGGSVTSDQATCEPAAPT